MDGYLIRKRRAQELVKKESQFDRILKERNQFRDLVQKLSEKLQDYKDLSDELASSLSEAVVLSNQYQSQRDRFEEELVIVEEKYLDEQREKAKLEARYEALKSESWSTWEVGLLSAGVGLAAVLVGVGATALVFEFK